MFVQKYDSRNNLYVTMCKHNVNETVETNQ